MKRILCSVCSGSFVALGAWIAGYDFDSRGFVAVNVFIWSAYFAGSAYWLVNWKKKP